MRKDRQQRKWSRKARLFMLVNVVVLFFLLVAFGREYVGNLQIEHEIRELEQERARLEEEQLSTLNLINELSSEYYLEGEARTKHGLAREGETLIIVEGAGEDYGDSASGDVRLQSVPNYTRWFYYFFAPDTFETLSYGEGS